MTSLPTKQEAYALNNKVTYTSANTNIATVDTAGFVRSVSRGSTIITVSNGLYSNTVAFTATDINQPLSGTSDPNLVIGGTAKYTAGNMDPVGQGFLQLTAATGWQVGYAYFKQSFTLASDIVVNFDFAFWGGTDLRAADGLGIALQDATVPFAMGQAGGAFGYCGGMPGGYVGIMMDEYGSFCRACGTAYPGPPGSLACDNTITIRGSVSGFGNGNPGDTTSAYSYPW